MSGTPESETTTTTQLFTCSQNNYQNSLQCSSQHFKVIALNPYQLNPVDSSEHLVPQTLLFPITTKNMSEVMDFAYFSGSIAIFELFFLVIPKSLTNLNKGMYVIP